MTVATWSDIFEYDPDTGLIKWKIKPSYRVHAGSIAGSIRSDGYIIIAYSGERYYAHRLAWLLSYGSWPEEVIDHIDGNPSNNKLVNLRSTTQMVNSQNRKLTSCRASTGLLGAFECSESSGGPRFFSQIVANRRNHYLGKFHTAKEAHEAYLRAKIKYHLP